MTRNLCNRKMTIKTYHFFSNIQQKSILSSKNCTRYNYQSPEKPSDSNSQIYMLIKQFYNIFHHRRKALSKQQWTDKKLNTHSHKCSVNIWAHFGQPKELFICTYLRVLAFVLRTVHVHVRYAMAAEASFFQRNPFRCLTI